MQVLGRDPAQEHVEIVNLVAQRFDNYSAALFADIDDLFEIHLRRFQYRSRDPDSRAISPFPYDTVHT